MCPVLNNVRSTLLSSKYLLCEVPKCADYLKVNRNKMLCLKVYLLPLVNTPGFYFPLDILLPFLHERVIFFLQLYVTNREKEITTVVMLLSGAGRHTFVPCGDEV